MDEVFKALADPDPTALDRLNARNGQTLRELCEGPGDDPTGREQAPGRAGGGDARHHRSPGHGRSGTTSTPCPSRRSPTAGSAGTSAAAGRALRLKRALEGRRWQARVRLRHYIQTTPEKLYRALTEPQFIELYFGGTGPQSDWEVGSPVRWKSDPNGEFEELGQRVLVAEPGRRLSYTWHTLQPMHRALFGSDDAFAEA